MSVQNQLITDENSDRPEAMHCSSVSSDVPFIPFDSSEVEQSIPARFEKQANIHGGRIAVRSLDSTLTYDGLNRFANRIARAIASITSRGCIVGLLLKKDVPMFASIIGSLKAGTVYVALSPYDPYERLSAILDDAGASLILTDTKNGGMAGRLAQAGRLLLNVDSLDAGLADDNVVNLIKPDDLAYIVYTSGSTGQSKGVMQNHRNVLHNAMNHTNSLKISPTDHLTLLAYFTTAQAMTDTFCALLTGASIHSVDIREEGLSGLSRRILAEAVTIYHSSATVYREFLAVMNRDDRFPGIRIVKLGSEPASKRDIELTRPHVSKDCIMVNALSSSETNTICQYFLDWSAPIDGNIVPVGHPVGGMEVQLLGNDGNEVGQGEVGEIVVKSDYMSPGYWRQPDLTRNVFSDGASGGISRMYHSGDLGRRLADGSLVHFGRKDSQVKVRGYRVELAEVEMALIQSPLIKEAAVVVKCCDGSGENSIVAYIVPATAHKPVPAELRGFLLQKLTSHMIPSQFVTVTELPRTTQGKIDRRGLDQLGTISTSVISGYVRPRGSLQWEIVKIWEDLLCVYPIGVRSDFIELGGYSLLAVRMIDCIEQKTGFRIPLAALIEGTTVERIAQMILDKGCSKPGSPLIALRSCGARQPFYFVHGDYAGGGFYCKRLASLLGDDQPFYVFQSFGLDGQPVPRTIEKMAEKLVDVLIAHQPKGPYLLGGYCNGGLIANEMARRLKMKGHEISLLVLIDASGCFSHKRFLLSLLGPVRDPRVAIYRKLASWIRQAMSLPDDSRHSLYVSLSDAANDLKSMMCEWRRALRGQNRSAAGAGFRAARQICLITCRNMMDLLSGRRRESAMARSENEVTRIRVAYRTATWRYLPKSHGGHIVVLRSKALDVRFPDDPTAGWGKVADVVEVQRLPGNHLSCITEHVADLAKHIDYFLKKAV